MLVLGEFEFGGLSSELVVDESGTLIDGRNRLQVGWAIGLDPTVRTFQPTDVVGYIVSTNIVRRHLTAGQRAMVAAELATLPVGRPSKENVAEATVSETATLMGVHRVTVQHARVVRDHAPELVEAVRNGEESLADAYEVAAERKRRAAERLCERRSARGV